MIDNNELLNILKENKVIVANNRLNPNRNKYLENNIYLDNIYSKYISKFRTEKEAIYCLINNISIDNIPTCPMCGKLSKFSGKYYNITCGQCNYNDWDKKKELTKQNITPETKQKAVKKRQQTCLKQYGSVSVNQYTNDELRQKYESDCLKKYGVKNAWQSEQSKLKRKQTCLKRYGVENNLLLRTSADKKKLWDEKHDEILEKTKQTSLLKYGTDSPNQSEKVKNKQKQSSILHYGSLGQAYQVRKQKSEETKLKRYGNIKYNNIEQIKQTVNNQHSEFESSNNCTRYTKLISEYGQGWLSLELPYIYHNRYRYIDNKYIKQIKQYSSEIHTVQSVSKSENKIYDYIKSIYNGKIIKNSRKIIKDNNHQYELDIYIPELKLAFEFNGNFWHSSKFKDKYYHQTKSLLCFKQNILLIHIYEFEYINDKENCFNKIKDMILNRLKSNDNKIIFEQSEPKVIYKMKCKDNIYNVFDDGLKYININLNE